MRNFFCFVLVCVYTATQPLLAVGANLSIGLIDGHGGVPINVADTGGRGKPGFLFIHGNGQSYLSWHHQLESDLADDFHLVAFDLRGHGNSGKPWRTEDYNRACIWADDIDAVLESTGLEQPVMVGWSRGGLIAMHYVRCRGTDGLSAIVMVGSRGRLVPVTLPTGDAPSRVSQTQLETDDIRQNMAGAKTFNRLMTVEDQGLEWNEIATAMNVLAPPYARRAMRAPIIGPTSDVETDYGSLIDEINVPLVVVLGASDPLRSSQELADAYQAAKPDADILMYPGVGHSPFLEAPERFNADMRALADKIFEIK